MEWEVKGRNSNRTDHGEDILMLEWITRTKRNSSNMRLKLWIRGLDTLETRVIAKLLIKSDGSAVRRGFLSWTETPWLD